MNLSNYKESGNVDTTPLISWTINDNCQYRCTYCYVDLKKDVNPKLSYISKLVMMKLSNIPDKFRLELLGGEPTIHPDYNDILNKAISIDNIVEVAIVTNLNKDISFWEEHVKHDKINIMVSLHSEYVDNDLREKLLYLSEHFNVECLVMVHPLDKYIPVMKNYISLCLELNISYGITMVHDDGEMVKYSEEISSELKSISEGEIEYIGDKGPVDLSIDEIYNNNLHKFKGWNCMNKYYMIDTDGNIGRACTGQSTSIILFKTFSNEVLVCDRDSGCICDEYLEYKKWV